jgi:hypothetical protein
MQILHCVTCDTAPLTPPRLANGTWVAQCPGCLADNLLEPDYSNVFLPLKFKVVLGGAATRRADRPEPGIQRAP